MLVGSVFVFVTLLTSVHGTCQNVDGQSVPWWILYQQKERPFFHQYVDSTNSHRVKEHYPERKDSVLSRVMSSVIDQNEAEYIIYSSDLINVKNIAAKTSIPTYSKWMHGILGTTSSWNSGFWILHNNLLFPSLQNNILAVPGSKAWYATTVGDGSADLFYICLTAENKGNITEMLISIMAGNPFIYKRKLHNYHFLQPYLKEVRSLQTSFGYEMSASIFLGCMYKSSTNISSNCMFTYAVTTGVGISVFTRSRGMIKHNSAFCYDDQSISLFDFLNVEKRSALQSGFSPSLFVLSEKAGMTCFGQDVAVNTQTVAVMICATLPNVYGTMIKSARLTKWSCRLNKYNSVSKKQSTKISNFPVIKQTKISKPQVGSNEGENSEITANFADDVNEKNVPKFCQMYDCEVNGDHQNEAELFGNHPLKNPLMKSRKIRNWFSSMVADIEMQNNIENPRKNKKMSNKESNAIMVKGSFEVSRLLLVNKNAVLGLFCREGCRFCQNAKEQFMLLAKHIQTEDLDFVIVDIHEPSLPVYLQVPFTPYIRYKFSGLSEWIEYSGKKYDIEHITIFLHSSITAKRSMFDDFDKSDVNADSTKDLNDISNLSSRKRKRRESRYFLNERSTTLSSYPLIRVKRNIDQSFINKHIWVYHGKPWETITKKKVQLELKERKTFFGNSRKVHTFIVTENQELTLRKLIHIANDDFRRLSREEIEKGVYVTFRNIDISEIDATLIHINNYESTCWFAPWAEITVIAYIKRLEFYIHHFETKLEKENFVLIPCRDEEINTNNNKQCKNKQKTRDNTRG